MKRIKSSHFSRGGGMRLVVSIAQMDIALGDPKANLAKARQMVAEAKHRGSEVILLPELWATGYDLKNAARHATATEEGTFAAVARLAEENGIYVIGSLLSERDGRCYNTATIFSPQGELVGRYDKAHLFRLMGEDRYLAAGTAAPVFELPWAKAALAICYDLRFPELFRRYALLGAKVIFIPAEWPCRRIEHWRTLLQARAIENQCFIVACNRVGESKGERFCGRSAVYDPWGEPAVEGGKEEILLTTEIDLDLVNEVRRRIPVFEDRREELYSTE